MTLKSDEKWLKALSSKGTNSKCIAKNLLNLSGNTVTGHWQTGSGFSAVIQLVTSHSHVLSGLFLHAIKGFFDDTFNRNGKRMVIFCVLLVLLKCKPTLKT